MRLEALEHLSFNVFDVGEPYPASKHTVGEFAGFGWSVSGCPGGGREFGNATDWKIAQPGQH